MLFTRGELFYSRSIDFFLLQNPDSHKIIKSAIYNFYRYSNTYFSTTISLIPSIKVSIESLMFVLDVSVQKPIIIPIVRKFNKQLILLIYLDNQSHFSVTTGMISPTKVSIENLPFAEDDSVDKYFNLIHAADS